MIKELILCEVWNCMGKRQGQHSRISWIILVFSGLLMGRILTPLSNHSFKCSLLSPNLLCIKTAPPQEALVVRTWECGDMAPKFGYQSRLWILWSHRHQNGVILEILLGLLYSHRWIVSSFLFNLYATVLLSIPIDTSIWLYIILLIINLTLSCFTCVWYVLVLIFIWVQFSLDGGHAIKFSDLGVSTVCSLLDI